MQPTVPAISRAIQIAARCPRSLHGRAIDAATEFQWSSPDRTIQGSKLLLQHGGIGRAGNAQVTSAQASAAIRLLRVPPWITPGFHHVIPG